MDYTLDTTRNFNEFSPVSSSTHTEEILLGTFSVDSLNTMNDQNITDSSCRQSFKNLDERNRKLLSEMQASVHNKSAIVNHLTFLSSEVTANKQLVEGLKDFGPQQGCANRKFNYRNMLASEEHGRSILMNLQQKVETLESQARIGQQYPPTDIHVNKTILSEVIDIRNRTAVLEKQIAKLVKELDKEQMKVHEEQIQKKIIYDELFAIKLAIDKETAKASTKLRLSKRIGVQYIGMLCFNFLIAYFTWYLSKFQ